MRKIFILICLFCFLFPASARAVEIQEVTGPKSGVKAWLVEDHKLPIVALRFAFQGGSEQDPPDKQGLAALTTAALTEGAGAYDAAAFQQQLEDHSIEMGFGAERDELDGGLKCLSADEETAFDLLHLALTEPRFENADIERLRAEQLSGIRRQFSDPGWQARYALLSRLFAGHPYGQRHFGTLQTFQAIARDDIRTFAARHLAQDNVTVAVAGDITPDELSAALDKIFAGLPAHARLKPVADVAEIKKIPSVLVRREGTQTELLFAMPGPKRDDPDYYAAEVANYIVGGGGFSSRLMQEVRDKKGLTYGISTSLAPSQHAGLIVGDAAVDNPKMGEALKTIRETMRRFYDKGPTAREIDAAKDYLTGALPLTLTSTDKIADLLIVMQRENLGLDFLDRYNEIIRSVTDRDIARVQMRFFNPDKITYVMVGKPQDVTPAQIKDEVRQ
jgi:zinc protease